MIGVERSQSAGREPSLGGLQASHEDTAGAAAPASSGSLDHALDVLVELVGHGRSSRALPKDARPETSAPRPEQAPPADGAAGEGASPAPATSAAAPGAQTARSSGAASVEIAAEAAGIDPEPPSLTDVVPDELRDLLLRAAGDPLFCLALLDASMKTAHVRDGVLGVQRSSRESRDAALERERAIEKAIKKAHRRCHMPKWLRKLVKAIATVASAVVAAMSGGAGVVALVGMVLLLTADHIGKLAVKLGMDPKKAKWLVVGLQAVGAAMSIVAGGMGATSLASSAAELARDTVKVVGAAVEAVGKVVEGGYDIADASFQSQAAMAQASADRAGVQLDAAHLGLDDAMAVLREGLASLSRGLEVENDLLRLRNEARRATLERAV
jgi:hypothetical protein